RGGRAVRPGLAGDPVADVEAPEPDELPRAQPSLLRELEPGQLLGLARLPVRPAALRERPGTSPDRVAVLLDQVEAVVLGRDDQREVALLHESVGAAGAVAPFDLVAAQPDPGVPVAHAGGEHADVRVVVLSRHEARAPPARIRPPPARRPRHQPQPPRHQPSTYQPSTYQPSTHQPSTHQPRTR